jgi:hypothetical protein
MLHATTIGPVTTVGILNGAKVDVNIVEDRFGTFYLQYEFSRARNQWRFVSARACDDMAHPASYGTKSSARRAAKRVLDRNN